MNNTKIINNDSNNINKYDSNFSDDENDDNDDDGSAVDMSNFLENNYIEENDPNLFVCKSNVVDKETKIVSDLDEELLRTRTYDLHITYDKYYQVKKLFNNKKKII